MFENFRLWYTRFVARSAFMSSRLVVYEGLVNMLNAGASSKTPTFAAQFGAWAQRARSREQSIGKAHAEIQRRLSAGRGLAQSLAPFIPIEEVMIIDAGEASGKLNITFESLIRSVEATRDMDESTRAAYKDPMVALLSFIALSIFSGLAVWPSMLQALPEKYWDGWAMFMINMQLLMTENWFFGFTACFFYLIYKWSLPRWTGQSRQFAESVFPPYASYRDRQAASLLIVMSGLLRAGKTIDQTLGHIARQGTPYLRWHTRSMQRRLVLFAGEPAKMLGTGIFSDSILDRIANASASRQLAETVQHIGTDAIDQVTKTVKKSAEIGANLLFVFIGLLISYYTAVQVIGAQQAADRFMREVKTGASVTVSR